jgi:hypothetical protein
LDLKQEIEKKLKIPVPEQKLLLIGKNLSDEKNIDFYTSIKDGTKITLVQKKPDNLQTLLSKHFKKIYTEEESNQISKNFLQNLNNYLLNCSLDDLERLSTACLENP